MSEFKKPPGAKTPNHGIGPNGFVNLSDNTRVLLLVSAVFVRGLRELQEEPRTVLPTPTVAGAGWTASAQRDRTRQGGGQGRTVHGQPSGRPATSPAAAAERVR